jgi:hypothetical protein
VWDRWILRLRQAGVDVDDNGEFFGYLGSRKEDWGYQSSVLIWEFLWVVERLGNRIDE